MTWLPQRSVAEEQMDAVDLPPDTYAKVLGDLAPEEFPRPGAHYRYRKLGIQAGDDPGQRPLHQL